MAGTKAKLVPIPENDPYIKGRQITVYLPAALYNQVLGCAKEESRSLSNTIEVLCRRSLKQKDTQ